MGERQIREPAIEPAMAEMVEHVPARVLASTTLLVFVGCFLGASVGGWLRLRGVGTAILFPPYAVLTAALLRSPPRRWWIYMLAAAAGDFLPHRYGGATTSFALSAEAANYARVLLAAAAVRRFGDPRGRLDSLRAMAVFLVFAAAAAPAVAALIGAAVVVLHEPATDFWFVWRAWFLSNVLTALTLLPLLAVRGRDARPRLSASLLGEAALLALGLFAVGAYVFLDPRGPTGGPPAHLYWPLPFLLWAAVRFGPRGASGALLGLSLLAVWGAIHGHGPFVAQAPDENLLQLQLFLIVVSVPLLLLAALIRERRQTATALRDSRERYQSVVEDQTELICRFLPDGTCTFMNGACCRHLQRTSAELVGRSMQSLLSPAEYRAARESLDTITPECPVVTRETRFEAPGGEVRWLVWRDRGLFDERNRVVEYQSVGRDITERKQSEDRQRMLEAQRQVEVALREADRRKDEFLAMLAHELRNPLAPIAMAAEILRDITAADEKLVLAQEVIARQTRHLTRLVDDLLDVSRITRGQIELRHELLDAASIVAQAIETSRPLIAGSRHALSVHLPTAPVYVRGDAIRLCQVVANLLNNAAKYTEPGGRIDVTVEREGALVILRVQDDGIGIPEEMLDRIFELFVQMEGSRKRGAGGLGIGLTLVKRLVEMHGGTVEARSRGPGRGAELIVRLPAAEAPGEVAAGTAQVSRGVGAARRRILVVDDNEDAAVVLAAVLEHQGHEVRVAHDGLAALAAVETMRPDVVFLDIDLPRLDGLEVARRLRSRSGSPALLLVATTGFGRDEDRQRTTEAGFDRHLVKPIDPASISALLSGRAG